ncbi:hypothetical protein H6A66_03945 [Bacteroides caecigallinarum]|uniref:hypothetical protein n=1 Tax=Bacteroides caecigallinarum TaxID=1411144 RepID=UPI001958ABFD|nr:hypothetical protein [Bacteroides caecigallinarum]MBM6864330.1 hypothetical protein [Bacteroides caecigallinarum]
MKQEKKKWNEMTPKEKKDTFKGCLATIVIFIILLYALKGCLSSGDSYGDNSQDVVTTVYPKLSTPHYDSIYALKAYPAIDLNNPPRIDFNSTLKKVEVKIRLTKKLDKEELKSIGIYYRDKYLAHPYNRVYVFYYTPEYKREDAGCYATTHSDPELEVYIMDAAKYQN